MAAPSSSSLTFLGLAVVLLLAAVFFLADRDPVPVAVRAPTPTNRHLEDAVDRLTQAVVRLEAAIQNLPAPGERTVERTVQRETIYPPGSSGAEQRFAPRNEQRLLEVQKLPDEPAPLTRHFFLWSYRDVIAEYGWPDDIWVGDAGVKFLYQYPSDESLKNTLIFAFLDGVVVQAQR